MIAPPSGKQIVADRSGRATLDLSSCAPPVRSQRDLLTRDEARPDRGEYRQAARSLRASSEPVMARRRGLLIVCSYTQYAAAYPSFGVHFEQQFL